MQGFRSTYQQWYPSLNLNAWFHYLSMSMHFLDYLIPTLWLNWTLSINPPITKSFSLKWSFPSHLTIVLMTSFIPFGSLNFISVPHIMSIAVLIAYFGFINLLKRIMKLLTCRLTFVSRSWISTLSLSSSLTISVLLTSESGSHSLS